jgi:hypothetical protein
MRYDEYYSIFRMIITRIIKKNVESVKIKNEQSFVTCCSITAIIFAEKLNPRKTRENKEARAGLVERAS